MRLGAIAVNCFMLTSLDTTVRLVRYQIQELSNYRINRYIATVATIAVSLAIVYVKAALPNGTPIPIWGMIWPIFGAANQLVAALTILAVAIWLIRSLKKNATFLLIPFWFMITTSLAGFVIYIRGYLLGKHPNYVIAAICTALFIIALFITFEGFKALKRDKDPLK